ncbi:MAG: trypsin-like peptidase domain-containing protein [Clostridia bacterium]|nr:trypsin-like peptidase domain-containing protein [Clostridia bacterium]
MNEELKNIDPSENGEAAEPTPSSVTDAAPVSPAQPAEPVPEASADEKATETPAAEQPSEAPAAEPVQPNPQQSYAHPNPQYAYTQPNYTRPVNNPAANGYSPYNQYPQTPGPGVYYGGAPTYIQPQPPKPKKQKKEKKKNPTRAVAWLTALCIVCSALFGVGGVFVGSLLFGNGSINNVTGSNNASGINYNTGEIMTPKDSDGTVVTAVQIAADSVVEITTEQVAFYFGEYISSGAGSGVIIDSDGYIITCAHVVDGADSITVKLSNGDSHEAKLIGSDTQTDIAVIKIEASGLVAASIGDSDKVVVGETAIAIGNPLGSLGGTVTSGIVSALNREIEIDGQKYNLLQTDASINPGNSGGGLFDIDGNLIGIVNAKSSDPSSETTIEGLGFAIPINQAVDIAKQLVDKGYVGGRVNLGVYVCEVNEGTSLTSLYQQGYASLVNYITEYGVYFLEYVDGQSGDLLFGDRIIAIDDVSVTTRNDILSLLEEYEIGQTVTVSVSRMNSDMRRSQIVDVSLTLVEQVPETVIDE